MKNLKNLLNNRKIIKVIFKSNLIKILRVKDIQRIFFGIISIKQQNQFKLLWTQELMKNVVWNKKKYKKVNHQVNHQVNHHS